MTDQDYFVERRFDNLKKSATFARILDVLSLKSKKMLDLGCGYGEYLVAFGEGSLGITTTLEEVEYGKQHSIRIVRGNVEELAKVDELQTERFDGIWSNNLFEHLLAPHAFLNSLKRYANDDALLVLGVPVVPAIPSLMNIKKFRGALAVSHINFFTRKTLQLTAERAGWNVIQIRPFIFEAKWLDAIAGIVAPHVYVVARNDATFTYPDKKLKEWKDEPYYTYVLETTHQAT